MAILYINSMTELLRSALISNNRIILEETTGMKVSGISLWEKSQSLAVSLSDRGFKKGDRILLFIRPGIDAFVSILAILRLGGVIAYIDPGMGGELFRSRVKFVKPKWVLTERIISVLQNNSLARLLLGFKGYTLPKLPPGNYKILYPNIKSAKDRDVKELTISDNSDAFIIFTSGSTNKPKAVVHTAASLSETAKKLKELCDPVSTDSYYGSLPHVIFACLLSGINSIIPRKSFSPATWLKDIKKFQPTLLFGPPAEFLQLYSFFQQRNEKFQPSIKKIFLGSAPVTSGFLNLLLKVVYKKTEVYAMYGLTELLPASSIDARTKVRLKTRGDCLGYLAPGVKARILIDGQLALSAPQMFDRYLGKPKAKEVKTGDIARFDGNLLVLLGRKKDMIIRGNYNIYPSLYEPLIDSIPGVAASAMVGIWNEGKNDEDVILFVEPEGVVGGGF